MSIFISYSRSDGAFARDVASRLREAGCTVWQDASGLYGGQAWSRGIDQAIRSCDVLLIVLSPDSYASEWVQKETLLAMKLRKPIVPVLFREAEIPVQLVDLQFVDFRGNRAEAIPELLTAISGSTAAHKPFDNSAPIAKRLGKPLALLVGAVALAIVVFVAFADLGGDSTLPTRKPTAGSAPAGATGHSTSGAPAINRTLGTFTTEFQKSDMVDLVFGYTLGNQHVCSYHNITIGAQDVGKRLQVGVGHVSEPEARNLIELKLYRSLVGPWKGGQTIEIFEKQMAEAVGLEGVDQESLSWKVNRAGDYVLCLQIQTNQYLDGQGNARPGFNFARYLLLLSDS
ncbi:MAG: toll/interleukin-1 receptor domain-containing protein [Gemmatimonadota bacterium]|nr:toll/interleukin-1 receptor domain-containing protein [Gemmatimonadota bacterium]